MYKLHLFSAFVNHRKMQLIIIVFFCIPFYFFVWRISSLLLIIRLVGNFVLFQLYLNYLSWDTRHIGNLSILHENTIYVYISFWVSSRTVNKAAFHTSFKQQHQAIGPQLRKNSCHFCLMIWKKKESITISKKNNYTFIKFCIAYYNLNAVQRFHENLFSLM